MNASETTRSLLAEGRRSIAGAVALVREADQLPPSERRTLNAAIDDVAAELGRAQTAVQRALERTTPEEPS